MLQNFLSLLQAEMDAKNQLQGFVSCLTSKNITDFTPYFDPNYNKILYSLMHNLRYSDPSLPKPVAIIAPSTKEQLVNTVLCCNAWAIEIRVRCSGHSSEGTSSVATDGSSFVIIDMKNMDKISVDKGGGFVWIEGGATLGQSYLAISQVTNDYTIPAGTWPTVGVGGHISGGGIGHLARKYGLVADHVVDALLIDAKGRVLDRQAMGEEVFWAIRGGGGGIWGIVFAWKLQLVAVPSIVTTFTMTRSEPENDVADLFHRWQFIAPKLENKISLVAFIAASPGDTKSDITITFKCVYLGRTRDLIPTLQTVFLELGVQADDCKETSWVQAVVDSCGIPHITISDLSNRYLSKNLYFKAKYDYVRTPIPIRGIRAALDILEGKPKGVQGVLALEPLGGFMDEVPRDSIPFPHRKGNIYAIQYEARWNVENDEKRDEYIKWVREIYEAMTPYVSNSPRASYVNCIDFDLGTMNGSENDNNVEAARIWGEKYFLKNYDRLVRAKTIIDPHNVFRYRQGIPPFPFVTIGDPTGVTL